MKSIKNLSLICHCCNKSLYTDKDFYNLETGDTYYYILCLNKKCVINELKYKRNTLIFLVTNKVVLYKEDKFYKTINEVKQLTMNVECIGLSYSLVNDHLNYYLKNKNFSYKGFIKPKKVLLKNEINRIKLLIDKINLLK